VHSRGLFLHEFFTRVLPADRNLIDSLPSALRIRRAIRTFSLSISGIVTAVALLTVSVIYTQDMYELESIYESYPAINIMEERTFDESNNVSIRKKDISEKINALYSLRSLIIDLKAAQSAWIIPWTLDTGDHVYITQLKTLYLQLLKSELLSSLDKPLKERMKVLQGDGTSSMAGGLIRRINLLATEIGNKQQVHDIDLETKPLISSDYVLIANEDVSRDSADLFNELYLSYLTWNLSLTDLEEEQRYLQSAFVSLIERNHGDYSWVIDWANQQGNEDVTLSDFWGGTVKLANPPTVPSAYTLQGREFILEFLKELVEANDEASRLAAVRDDFEQFYARRYAKSWQDFASRFDEGKLRYRDRKEWLTLIDSLSTKENPYFSLIRRMSAELAVLEIPDLYDGQEQFDFFVDVQDHAGVESDEATGDNKKATKAILKGISKMGKVGKLVAKAGKKGMKAKKKMGGKEADGPDLDAVLDDAAEALKAYNLALADTAFNSESKTQSHNTISTLFTTPDNPGAGDGSMAAAYNAVRSMQRLVGKPRPSTKMFWSLYSGPMDIVYDYMEEETSCHLQQQWETEVLAEIAGVDKNKLGQTLIGESGLLWKYVDGTASPFLKKRFNKGFIPAVVNKRKVVWSDDFLDFINKASYGRSLVGSEFEVSINTLPTGVNIGAAISPYATFLELHCADGVQTLANYNYSDRHNFKWSLESCGDVSLQIDIGHISLRKQYNGPKGFSRFFDDFRDGRRVFEIDEFPNQASLLRKESVDAIDVNYEFMNHEPVLNILQQVPLEPPLAISQCWPSRQKSSMEGIPF
jgi:type VI secretion system protein ImpL